LTGGGKLVEAVSGAIDAVCKKKPNLSTAGGTSDGRFVAPTGAEVVEFGLINRTIHKVNEHALISDMEKLALVYEKILEQMLL
jgi:succinyl-diaminopimelate desuccinylase